MTEFRPFGIPLRTLWKPILCVVVCLALTLTTAPAAVHNGAVSAADASSLDSLNQQKSDLAAQQEDLAAQRNEAASTLEDQKSQSEILRKQISAKSEEIGINQQLLSELDGRIAEKTARITEQEATIASLDEQIAKQYQLLRIRLREIAKDNTIASSLQLLLDSKSYLEYLVGDKISERISKRDQELMDGLENDMLTVEDARNKNKTDKAALEIERTQVAAVQTEMEAAKNELQALYAESEALTTQMAQNVEHLDEQIASIDAQQSYLQNTIDNVLAQIAAEEEAKRLEQERLEQERLEQERLEQERLEQERQEQEDNQNKNDAAEGDNNDDTDNGSEDDDDDTGSDNNNSGGSSSGGNSSFSGMIWPAPTCKVITSSYKYREQFGRWHKGLDIACYGSALGQPIVAAADGVVRYANRYDTWGGGFGLYMMIDHGYDSQGRRIITVYAHCNEVTAYEGLTVKAGDRIGYIGNTGNSFGAHLHFEVQVDGVAVNPTNYLSTAGVDILG